MDIGTLASGIASSQDQGDPIFHLTGEKQHQMQTYHFVSSKHSECDSLILTGMSCSNPANSVNARWTKAWTSGRSSENTVDTFMWATGLVVTNAVDLSRVGIHLALDVADLKLHRYDGTTERMGVLCETSESPSSAKFKPLLTSYMRQRVGK